MRILHARAAPAVVWAMTGLSHNSVTASATELKMIERHIREGERHLEHQRQIISWLRDHHYPTLEAEKLLTNLEDAQRTHRHHLARLRSE